MRETGAPSKAPGEAGRERVATGGRTWAHSALGPPAELGRGRGAGGRVLSERMTSVRSAQARDGVLRRESGSVSCGRPRELLDPRKETELNLSKQLSDPVHPLPIARARPSGRRLRSGRGR